MKLGTSVVPHLHVILTILIIQGRLQGQKVNLKIILVIQG